MLAACAAAFLLLGMLAALTGAEPVAQVSPAPERGLAIDGAVVRVIDGDTLICRSSFEYRVRLIDCWAPESRTSDPDEKKLGLASKQRMAELASGKQVRVHIPAGGSDLSSLLTLGRVLGRVWTLNEQGQPEDVDLSGLMVRDGFATQQKVRE